MDEIELVKHQRKHGLRKLKFENKIGCYVSWEIWKN